MEKMNLLLALVAATLLFVEVISAQPIAEAEEGTCLVTLDKNLQALPVPEGVEKLIGFVRSLNAALPGESMNQLLADKRAELDLYKAGFIKGKEEELLVDACADYVSNLMGVMRETTCGQELIELSETNQSEFDKVLAVNPGLNLAYGYARACVRLLR